MSEIQKAIDEGHTFESWNGKNYVYTPEQLKSLLEQVAREQKEITATSISLSSRPFRYPEESEEIVAWLRNCPLITESITFNED